MPCCFRRRFLLLSIVAVACVVTVRAAEGDAAVSQIAAPKRVGPEFAFVCLADSKVPKLEELQAKLASWLQLPSAGEIKDLKSTAVDKKTVITFTASGRPFTLSLVGEPIPKADIDYACDNALAWPEAAVEMARQRAQLLVLASGDYPNPAEKALAVSQAAAAVSECFDTVGIYWSQASIAHSPAAFREEIKESDATREKLPVALWVGFLIARGKTGGMDVYTRGLESFGAMEVEILDSKKKTEDVFNLLNAAAGYLIDQGNVIKDGDTVGLTPTENVPSHYAESAIGRPGKVLRLDY